MNQLKLEKAKQDYKKRKGITDRVSVRPHILKGMDKPSEHFVKLNGEKKLVIELSNGDLEIV